MSYSQWFIITSYEGAAGLRGHRSRGGDMRNAESFIAPTAPKNIQATVEADPDKLKSNGGMSGSSHNLR